MNDLSFSNFVFPILISRMVNIGILSTLSKFEKQILNYKQDTGFEILCFVNKARAFPAGISTMLFQRQAAPLNQR